MSHPLPLVSIGIPTYNRADGFLKQAIRAALNQTYPEIEVVISDNCSPDNTEEVVRSFSDPRIRYFRQTENIGANNNFNFCVKQARGAYILLLPDDDLIDEDFIEVCMKAANFRTDIGIIRSGMRRIDLEGKITMEHPNRAVGLPTDDFFLNWFEDRIPMHLCMTLFNKDRLIQIGGLQSRHQLFQDVLAEVRLAAEFGRVDIEDIKASFRMHPEQDTVSAKTKAWCEDSFLLFDTILSVCGGKKEMLRKRGKIFFFRHNYRIARRNKSFLARFTSCFVVFKEFGFVYSLRRVFEL